MKKNIYILMLLTSLAVGCDKDKYLRLPVVETTSVELSGTEVIVTGTVIDDGNTSGLILGFCYEKGTAPENILINQILVRQMYENGRQFQTAIPDLEQGATYCFQTFIANDQGYTTGNVISYTVPRYEAPEAPCASELTTNRITDEGRTYTASVSATGTSFSLNLGSYNPNISFHFKEKPVTGAYKTVSRINPYSTGKDVEIQIDKRIGYFNTSGDFKTGQFVYINNADENRYIVSFCDVEYSYYNSMTYTTTKAILSGKFEATAK